MATVGWLGPGGRTLGERALKTPRGATLPHWWRAVRRTLGEDRVPVTYQDFKVTRTHVIFWLEDHEAIIVHRKRGSI